VKVNYLSKEGYDNLKAELRDLMTRGRKEIARQIDEARSHGDLSENAEYDAAKEAQGKMETRISELEKTLANSRVLDGKNIDNSKAYVLSTVSILNRKTQKEMQYTLVSKAEADFNKGKISVDSPIGKALMGKSKGDVVKVKVPAGLLELEIRDIQRTDKMSMTASG
jgi:transcription elongation factor GreA